MILWLWGYVKLLVYRELPQDIDDRKLKIRAAFREINGDVRNCAIADFGHQVRLCLQQRGSHIEI